MNAMQRRLTAVGAVLIGVVGCDSTTVPGAPTLQPASVEFSVDSIRLTVLGDSLWVSVTVRDQHGNAMANQPVTWGTSNPDVATASPTGYVTAVSNGVANVWAQAASVADTLTVTVDDPIADDYLPDREVLIALHELTTERTSWYRSHGWNGVSRVPMKEWHGVTVALDPVVGKMRPERIDLSDNNLIADRVPPEIGQLTHLRVLNLERSSWGGFINSSQTRLAECLPSASLHWPLCDTPHSALPRELMNLPRLDSLELGWGGCVPATDPSLLEWVRERELYSISHPLVPDRFFVRKTSECLHAGDIKELTFDMAQAVSLGDSLIEGRDAWIAVQPVRERRSWPIDSMTVHRELVTTWPEVTALVCDSPGASCTGLEMMQRAADTVTFMLSGRRDRFIRELRRSPWRSEWRSGVAVGKIPGEFVKPGMSITIELSSRTVGDTVRLLEYQARPVVSPALAALPITLVAVVPPNPECRDSVLGGHAVSDDCHEWPDSAFANYRRLKDDPEARYSALFQHLEHWFPVEGVDVQWHDEFVYSKAWDRVIDQAEAATDDLRRIDAMRRDAGDDRYWVGLWCLIGSCGYGVGLGGIAHYYGRTSVSIPHGAFVAHEIGHNLGLWHPDEIDPETASVDAMAVGKWFMGDNWWQHQYVEAPVPAFSNTFMHSQRSNSTGKEGEGIAPWQFRQILAYLSGTFFRQQEGVVIVN